MNAGKIYLIPTFISESETPEYLPVNTVRRIINLEVFIVEEIKTARRFLRKIGYNRDFSEVTFFELNEHTANPDLSEMLQEAHNGRDIGLLSEAGSPCIADPGSNLVLLAHQKGIRIIPLTGPGSIYMALMASGLNGQKFTFHGYLPVDAHKQRQALKDIEREIRDNRYTHIFIETPYRNQRLFEAILRSCSPDLYLCIACNLSAENEFVETKMLGEWKSQKPDLDKKPAVFLMNL